MRRRELYIVEARDKEYNKEQYNVIAFTADQAINKVYKYRGVQWSKVTSIEITDLETLIVPAAEDPWLKGKP